MSTLQFCSVVVGNSSSGIIEVPSFGIPTVNIGDRQKGRISGKTVIHCGNGEQEIENALNVALSYKFKTEIKDAANPYEGENTSDKIIEVVTKSLEEGIDLKKKFYDLDVTK